MMHITMEQIAIKNAYARSTELWNFQNRLGLGPRDDVTALTL